MDVKIEDSWKQILKEEFSKPYFQQIALHQMKIRTLTYIRAVLDAIMRRGAYAEHDIRTEDDLNG